jgi:tight adherence protein B
MAAIPTSSLVIFFVAFIFGVAVFAWGVIEIGTKGMAKYREAFTTDANVRMRELFLFADPQRLYALHLAFVLLVLLLAWVISGAWPIVVMCLIGAVVLPQFVLRRLRQRRLDTIESQLPDAMLIMGGAMRAGMSMTAAVQQLVQEGRPPITQEFSLVLREQRLGVSIDQALINMDARVPLQSMTLAIAAMRIATETGGGLAEALERAATTLRAKLAMEGKIRALTSQGKLQAWVVGLLPIVLLFVLMRMEPVYMPKIFTTHIGWATLAVVALLEFFGIWLIRKIVAIDV